MLILGLAVEGAGKLGGVGVVGDLVVVLAIGGQRLEGQLVRQRNFDVLGNAAALGDQNLGPVQRHLAVGADGGVGQRRGAGRADRRQQLIVALQIFPSGEPVGAGGGRGLAQFGAKLTA